MQNIIVKPQGKLVFGKKEFRCAIGKNGVSKNKQEGDGATPIGCFPIREVFYRADRIEKPKTVFPVRALNPNDGWCDDSKDKNYNKFVKLPYPANSESLWRDDYLYDVIVVIGYNDNPPISEKGSAIFMHVARENYSPTAGCVALALPDLLEIIKDITPETKICVAQ